MIWIFLGTLLGCVVLGIPVAVALGVAATVLLFAQDRPVALLVEQAVHGVNSFPLLAIPLFILMGEIMSAGGIARRLVRLAASLVGSVTGGLGQVNVAASVFFGGLSGSAGADISAVGGMMIPAMRREHYPAPLATAITVASALIGILLPPSMPLILYGVVTNTSIADLFIAGIVPAMLIWLSLALTTGVVAKRRGVGIKQAFQFGELWSALRTSWLSLLLPVIIIGGIRGGVFTPTEAGAVSVVFALLVSIVYREIRWRELPTLILTSARRTGMVMLLVAMAMVVASLLTTAGIAQTLVSVMASVTSEPLPVLLLMITLLLVIGIFMDLTPAILILAPLMLPVVSSAGISPVYFGIIMVLVLGIGLLTPPVGTGLFLGCVVGKVTVEELVKSLPPFYIALLAVVALLVAFPALTFVLL